VELKELFRKFNTVKVIVAGDVMVDAYLRGTVNRISPEAPVPVVSIDEREERPGGAANVALNIRELGATPLLCTFIGKDDAAKSLLKILQKQKISTKNILFSAGRNTSVKTRVLSRNHQMLRYDMESTADLTAEEENLMVKNIAALITAEKPQALIFEDYNKGVLTASLITKVIRICHEHEVIVAVDPKKKNFFAYKNADLFKPNLREINEALNHDFTDTGLPAMNMVAKALKKKLPHFNTIITLSEQGVFYHSKKESAIIPAHKRDISDVSGAGDTVIAMATLCLAAGLPLAEAAALANIAGGLVCEQPGVVPVTKKMLLQEFKES
jgi:rfaE bifunctional protein kinase chain/domain